MIVAGLLVTCSFQAVFSAYPDQPQYINGASVSVHNGLGGQGLSTAFRGLAGISFLLATFTVFGGFVLLWTLQTLPIDEEGRKALGRDGALSIWLFWELIRYSFIASIACFVVSVVLLLFRLVNMVWAVVKAVTGSIVLCLMVLCIALFSVNRHIHDVQETVSLQDVEAQIASLSEDERRGVTFEFDNPFATATEMSAWTQK